jgi:cell wall-associated NlpC family hydrolase
MQPGTIDAYHNHCLTEYPREACGIVARLGEVDSYIPCVNVAADKDAEFEIDRHVYTAIEDHFDELLALVHSHPDVAATPSDADKVGCEASGLPWVIVSVLKHAGDDVPHVAGEHHLQPEGYIAPLIGRQFHHGVLDCYTLIQDWYAREQGIALPHFERRDKWWDDGVSDLYTEHFEEAGFERLPQGAPLQRGDVILMQIRSRNGKPNHGGVYLGDGTLLHHPYGRLSRVDSYGGMWMQYTRLIVRRRSAMMG